MLREVEALKNNDVDLFLKTVLESGRSSWQYLQNITPTGYVREQNVAVALALCDLFLEGSGAYRVHGGGFAGTVQAFVPIQKLHQFKMNIENVLGDGCCHVLRIRQRGGVRVK